MKLKDKVVLITGGGSGLGREMGLTFAREGASVGVNDIRPESAQNVVTEIERAGGKARPFVADVSSSAAVRKMFADFIAAFGTIDILINNAGIGRTRDTSEVIPTYQKTDEEWHKMLATHLDSTFYCTREALKVMIPKQSGRIINMGSVAGTTGLAFASDYCAAKGGIIAFTKSVAREVVAAGILVNCIAPGFIDTPMTAFIEGEFRQQLVAMTPMGRFGEPSDIAAAALFLACEDSKFMVGQVLSPNGGYVI
ncbi:MAG: SDR family NAD(P)-dependent oxidoreductase [Candidatus Binatus sp.]|uniref:SDR family NAD(P)-dependent oxidoreductase n=1 Tax=Candidatus Binatus sp. TaxID=2811406 RepID=UPI003D0F3C15